MKSALFDRWEKQLWKRIWGVKFREYLTLQSRDIIMKSFFSCSHVYLSITLWCLVAVTQCSLLTRLKSSSKDQTQWGVCLLVSHQTTSSPKSPSRDNTVVHRTTENRRRKRSCEKDKPATWAWNPLMINSFHCHGLHVNKTPRSCFLLSLIIHNVLVLSSAERTMEFNIEFRILSFIKPCGWQCFCNRASEYLNQSLESCLHQLYV